MNACTTPTPPPSPLTHTPVLLQATVDAVFTRPDGLYIDATYGRGGHSTELLSRLSPSGRVVAFDQDPQAVAHAQALARVEPRFSIIHAPFSQMQARLHQAGVAAHGVLGILLDLGVSSPQLDDAQRGLSFMRAGPLDMRMDPTCQAQPLGAWLAKASESQIAQVLHEYGEERHARRIAAAIARCQVRAADRTPPARPQTPGSDSTAPSAVFALESTLDLARLIEGVVKRDHSGLHPATRSFQAFRIFINHELEELQSALQSSLDLLAPQGRIAVISFHSLEDRRVKQFMAQHARVQGVDRRSPAFALQDFGALQPLRLKELGRTRPSPSEVKANSRARSAVLRVAQRTNVALVQEALPLEESPA